MVRATHLGLTGILVATALSVTLAGGCGGSSPMDQHYGTDLGADFRAPVIDAEADTTADAPDSSGAAGTSGSAGTGGAAGSGGAGGAAGQGAAGGSGGAGNAAGSGGAAGSGT
jgi:hypothetical protein